MSSGEALSRDERRRRVQGRDYAKGRGSKDQEVPKVVGSARREKSNRRRREMLRAYYETLRENGLQRTSIGKIAKRLGLHPSLFIHYFGTKEQMTIELVDCLLEVFRETYGDKLSAIKDPLDRLLAILDTYFTVGYQELVDDKVYYACFYLSLCHPRLREAFATLAEDETELLESTIAECMAEGRIPDGSPRDLTLGVKALEAGYAVLIAGSEEAEIKQQMGDSLKEQALRLLNVAEERLASR
jgi:AcrR family transcriptional regulator